VLAAGVQRDEVRLLAPGELGLFTAQAAFGLRDFHALARARAYEIGLELGDHREHVEQQPPDRIAGIVDRAAEVELDLAAGEVIDDVAGIR
jgi:hypothetical protein